MRRPAAIFTCVLLTAALGASVASAVGLPTAFTGDATGLLGASATVKGSVDPSDQPTTCWFQFGRGLAYEEQTQPISVPAGTSSVHVAAQLTGLAAGTVYHYRLVAVNGSGQADGQDRTLTSRALPLALALDDVSERITYGSRLVISGTLTGTGGAEHPVVLQGSRAPGASAFSNLGTPVSTDASGRFTFVLADPSESLRLRVAASGTSGTVYSPTATVLVAVEVTLHLASTARPGWGRLSGAVTPAQPGALVVVQARQSGGVASNVAQMKLHGGHGTSRFSVLVRLHPGLYQAVGSSAGPRLVAGRSRLIRVRGR
jgi:hypothetical protein